MSPNTCTILIFLAGNHILNTDFLISDVTNFFMLSTSSMNEGTHVIVNCQLQAHFVIDCANEVWINGLKFIGCGSNRFSSINYNKYNAAIYKIVGLILVDICTKYQAAGN